MRISWLPVLAPALVCAIAVSKARDSLRRTGNWSEIPCYSAYHQPPSEQWDDQDASDAWKDALTAWKTDKQRNDTSFSASVNRAFGAYAGGDCGTLDGCRQTESCWSLNKDQTGPAATTILDSLWLTNSNFANVVETYIKTLKTSGLNTDMGDFGGKKDVKTPKDDVWKPLLTQMVKLGTLSAIGGTFYKELQDRRYFLESGAVNRSVTALDFAKTSIAVAQEWADGKWTASTTPTGKDNFVKTMNQAADIWEDIVKEGLRRLFDGSDSSIDNLYSIISDGKLLDGYVPSNKTKTARSLDDLSANDFSLLFANTIFGFDLEVTWNMTGAAVFVLDSGRNCGDDNIDGLHLKAEIRETAGACVNGKQYYLVSSKGSGKEFDLPQGMVNGKPNILVGNYFFEGLKLPEIVTGSVRTYLANGNVNTGLKTDISNATLAQGLVTDNYTGAGFFTIPVCSASIAWDAQHRHATSSPGYPCNEKDSAGARVLLGASQLAGAAMCMAAAIFMSF